MANEFLINQSLIKDLLKYQDDELCGLVFTNKWINKNFGKSTISNNLGHYFEYLATGSLPKSGVVPIPENTKQYDILKKQVEYFKYLFEKKEIYITESGLEISVDNKWIGTLDIVANWKNIFLDENVYLDPKNKNFQVIIDLKYSGLLENKYSEFGWETESLSENKRTLLQAIHYKFLYWKKYGINAPFFFFVFDSKTPKLMKPIHVNISEEQLIEHENYLQKAKRFFEFNLKIGYKPKPEYKRCIECDYVDFCLFKEDVPKEIININL